MSKDTIEGLIDKEFNIETCEFDTRSEDENHRAYEPTPYDVLERLVESGFIRQSDNVVDMGCGKGRVAIYLSNKTPCKAIGVDFDIRMIELANRNYDKRLKDAEVSFICISAEDYVIKDTDSVFYFFNPFSVKILSKVLSNIENSFYNCQREIKLVFYYPTLEYVGEIMKNDVFDFVDEIDCSDLYTDKKGRECIMIFSIGSR